MQTATKDSNTSMASNSGQRAARRRRIDDVRQLQQERRRQANNNKQSQQLQQQYNEQQQQHVVYEMQDDYVNTGGNHNTGGYHSDANTTQSSSARSMKSPGGSSSHSTRSSLSAKRKNMMQRRIENRKRIEQRKAMGMQKQLSQEEELDRVYNMQHQQQNGGMTVHQNQSQQSQNNTGYNQPQHYNQQPYNTPQGYSNNNGSQQQQRRQLSFDDPEIQMSIQRQRRQSQSISGYGDSAQQQQQQQQQEMQRGPSRSQEQQYYNNPNQMPPLMSQPQRPPMQPHYQTPQNNNYYNTQQQQQQQLHNHSQLSSPRVIPSPPTVQRNNAASHPYPYDNNHMTHQHQPIHLMGEHSFEELEQSGIIRNNNNPASHNRNLNNMSRNRQPIMNRNHMVPSDEWDTSQSKRVEVNGYNSDGGGQQQQSRYNQQRSAGQYQQSRLPRQPQSTAANTSVGYNSDGGHSSSRPSPYNELRAAKQQYQMEQQRHQRRGPPPLMSPPPQLEHRTQQPQHYQQPRRSSPPRRASPPRQAHGAVVSHFMRNHPSMQQGNPQRQQRDISPQKQHTQPHQNIQPPPQQQQQNQPNWNEVNRQRMYQRQAVSKQQYQERQEHLQEQQQQLEKMEEEQRKMREKSRSPNRKKNIIPDSPVEHLGVRTDKIQRKNNIIVHHHANTAPSSAAGGRQRHPLPPPDDETISVSSLRKGWEKSHSPADSKHTSRSRNTAPPSSHHHRHHDENSPFGVWTERSERLLRARRREQRREQRKNIEDRWRSNFRGGGAFQSLPSSSQRQRNNGIGKEYVSGNDYGYQSEGERGGQKHRPERYDDGYQSEGQELVRSRNRYYDDRDDDYHQPTEEEQQQEEVEYNPDQMMFEEVPDTITPQDARARLWDQNERLRAVLPRNEVEGMGNVKDRWSEHHRPGDSVVSPRSNFSGSSGGRFKSKFVHAAAIATQQRATNINEGNRGVSYSPQRSQRHQQQQQGNYEVSLSQHENLRRRDSSPHKKFNAHKGSMAVLSHYTDSTAETTTLDTNPSRSFGSSQRHQVSNTSTTVRRVSPSPKSSSGQQQQAHPSSMMPPIAEQLASSEVGQSQVQNTTSVAELISRINAVSRSNPEEALAAIDSIIKTQHDTSTDTGHAVAPTQEVPPTPVKIASLFSPTRNETTPPIVNNARNNKNKELHVGKDFFQQKYEEVLHSDSLQVIRDANAAVVRDRASFDNSPIEEEDDCGSFLSSEDSTVSSMTNPTYQSRRDHEREQKHRHQKKASRSQEEPPDVEQKKSWNTLKREYNARKNSPGRSYSEEEELEVKQSHSRESRTTPRRKTRSHEEAQEVQVKQSMTPSDEEDIGLDKFSSAIQDEPDEDSVAWRQQVPLVESKDLSTGMCGMAFTKPGSKYSAAEDNSDLVDNNAWVSHDAAVFGNTGRSRREAQSKHRQDKKDPRPHPSTAPSRKLDNYLADNRTSSSKKAQVSHQSRQSKPNNRASPPPLEQPPKARASTPEIMKSMSDAFSNLDISLEATTAHRPSQDFYNTRPSHNEEYNDDPPLQTFESDPEDNPQSLKSISEAFSDVGTNDIFDHQEKTSSQRRKQLEYLAKSWTADSSGSPSFSGIKKCSLDNAFAQQQKTTDAADWAKETFKSNNTSKQKKIKKSEPSLRLKGNKSLASKFASLVKAYDD